MSNRIESVIYVYEEKFPEDYDDPTALIYSTYKMAVFGDHEPIKDAIKSWKEVTGLECGDWLWDTMEVFLEEPWL